MNEETTPLTPKMALAMILGALWRCALILIAFAAFVLVAPGLWPNK